MYTVLVNNLLNMLSILLKLPSNIVMADCHSTLGGDGEVPAEEHALNAIPRLSNVQQQRGLGFSKTRICQK